MSAARGNSLRPHPDLVSCPSSLRLALIPLADPPGNEEVDAEDGGFVKSPMLVAEYSKSPGIGRKVGAGGEGETAPSGDEAPAEREAKVRLAGNETHHLSSGLTLKSARARR